MDCLCIWHFLHNYPMKETLTPVFCGQGNRFFFFFDLLNSLTLGEIT